MTQWIEIIFDRHSLFLFVSKTYTVKLQLGKELLPIQKMPKLRPCNKEHLALVNNFAVNKKFLITKFDCI